MYLPDAGSLNPFPRLKASTREKKNLEEVLPHGHHLDGLLAHDIWGETGTDHVALFFAT